MDSVTATTEFVLNKTKLNLMIDQCIQERYSFIVAPIFSYTVVALYLVAVLVGPKLMAKRKAFLLTEIVKAYNIIQIIFNSYMIYKYFKFMGVAQGLKIWQNTCYPTLAANNFQYSVFCDQVLPNMMLYLINKMLDLTETIFFVLRKKNSQISFLHVYHHASVVILCNVYIYNGREEITAVLTFLNCCVHAIMYLYYFLASLGPSVKKLLWWKRYITRCQMIQLAAMMVILIKMFFYDGCEVDKVFLVSILATLVFFLYLFADFYVRAYSDKRKTK